jgi:hypothetical protein
MIFTKCTDVGRRPIALVLVIVPQSEMNFLGCRVGCSHIFVLVVLRWAVCEGFGRGGREAVIIRPLTNLGPVTWVPKLELKTIRWHGRANHIAFRAVPGIYSRTQQR